MKAIPISATHEKQLEVLGQYFKEYRLSAGMTQFELADGMGIELKRDIVQS